ncbi:TraR/DksA family transcriptional regulator [Paraburkholderia bryophila]|uniref:TraR/DksA family transcriptional regulator n=1 Tax=Paraburkholderia bryophila TaxID=420952 RepID=A0A329BA97_9BURK|nr:TraR/DksA family transcriptional regulator [Paraburkholderia bryophila]RAS19378.1 TraR/DksA family transcriptional regulator [Paraburkholderia bryophila]
MADQQSDLSEEFIARQRTRLEALRRQLLGGEASTTADDRAAEEEHGEEAREFEDTAQSMAQNEINQSLHDVNDQRVSDIERALRKIDEGTYGLSDESGEPIPQGRLEVMPEAILTVAEQSRRETGQ